MEWNFKCAILQVERRKIDEVCIIDKLHRVETVVTVIAIRLFRIENFDKLEKQLEKIGKLRNGNESL